MDGDYNLPADLLNTFRSLNDWIKALWILSVPGSLLGVLALVLRYRVTVRRLDRFADGHIICSVVAAKNGPYRVHPHQRDPAERSAAPPDLEDLR